MNAREAYRALTAGSLSEGCRARAEGWRATTNGAEVTVRNVRTGESLTGTRKLRKDCEWGRRVTWDD